MVLEQPHGKVGQTVRHMLLVQGLTKVSEGGGLITKHDIGQVVLDCQHGGTSCRGMPPRGVVRTDQ